MIVARESGLKLQEGSLCLPLGLCGLLLGLRPPVGLSMVLCFGSLGLGDRGPES